MSERLQRLKHILGEVSDLNRAGAVLAWDQETYMPRGGIASRADQLTTLLGQRGILVESILLRDIQLPLTLKTSIETKQQAEQEALAMNFRLQKETQEAQRKRIEAQGIRDFQQIVAQGISPQLLEWKGIEATELLAKSSNSKVVVIGNNKNGLPLILGQ